MTKDHELIYRRLASNYPNAVEYATELLQQHITPQQAEIAARLSEPPYKVLVPSANKVGKTFAAGWLINWWHDRYDPGIVLATSSSYRQVTRQLFKEVRRLRPFSLDLPPKDPSINHTERHYVLGFSTNKADAFQGHHEKNILILMDEATGVHSDFWDRSETMFQGIAGQGWLCFYNPNDPPSPAYAAEQSGDWHVVRLSALDHPNILAEMRGLDPVVPAAIRLDRMQKRIAKECEFLGDTQPNDGSGFQWPPSNVREWLTEPPDPVLPWGWYQPMTPLFEVQVLGRWPSKSMHSVWGLSEIERCKVRCAIDLSWPVQIGCDMARGGGDKIVIAVRKGVALIHLEALPGSTKSGQVAEKLRELCAIYAHGEDPRLVPVLIDDTGGYGAGVVDYPDGFNFVGIKASKSAQDHELYPNCRSELWWTLKIAADEGGFIVGSCQIGSDLIPVLQADLMAARYAMDAKNRRVIEGKEAMKVRLKRSPDYADAVCLAWYPYF